MKENGKTVRCGRNAAIAAQCESADAPRERAPDSATHRASDSAAHRAPDSAIRRAAAAAIVLAVTVGVTTLCLGVAGKFGVGNPVTNGLGVGKFGTGSSGDISGVPRGFSDASTAAVSAIRDNEALAVFLGWTEPDGAVPTGAGIGSTPAGADVDSTPTGAGADGAVPASVRTEDGIWLPDPPAPPPGFWDYFAAALARLLAP